MNGVKLDQRSTLRPEAMGRGEFGERLEMCAFDVSRFILNRH